MKDKNKRLEILMHIAESPEGLTATDLAPRFRVTIRRMSYLLHELEAEGLVRKREGTFPKNRKYYQITEEGNIFLISEEISKLKIKKIASETRINEYPYREIVFEILRDIKLKSVNEIVETLRKRGINKRRTKACITTLIKEGVLFADERGRIGISNLFFIYPYLNEFSIAIEERMRRARELTVVEVEKYANKKMPERIKEKWLTWELESPSAFFERYIKHVQETLREKRYTWKDFMEIPAYRHTIFRDAMDRAIIEHHGGRIDRFIDYYLCAPENIRNDKLTKEDVLWLIELKIGMIKHDLKVYSEALKTLMEGGFDDWFS